VPSASLERFAELVTREEFGLAEACLLIAQDRYPRLDTAASIARLDAIAATIRGRLAAGAAADESVAAINQHLFAELNFAGNAGEYYDPRNSYLNEVLERRTGIPITLSIVYLEVARRLGLAARGVSFPGHFLVKVRLGRGELVLDPFAGGEAQSTDALRERLERFMPTTEARTVDLARYLGPATSRQIVARVLRNLKAIYLEAGEADAALAVMNRLLLVVPESAEELRDRGLLYARLECFRPAAADLANYLRRQPDAQDAVSIKAQVAALRSAIARLN
jgi:regulator of sirC expression with transglutaminase-like and TPR domain